MTPTASVAAEAPRADASTSAEVAWIPTASGRNSNDVRVNSTETNRVI
jgi:hypothetical protein